MKSDWPRHITPANLFFPPHVLSSCQVVMFWFGVLHSSSSQFEWQTLCGYCYLEHTVQSLWWRDQIAYSPHGFILPFASLLSVHGELFTLVVWLPHCKTRLNSEQSVSVLCCEFEGPCVWMGEPNKSKPALLTLTLQQQVSHGLTSWSEGCEKSSIGYGWVIDSGCTLSHISLSSTFKGTVRTF